MLIVSPLSELQLHKRLCILVVLLQLWLLQFQGNVSLKFVSSRIEHFTKNFRRNFVYLCTNLRMVLGCRKSKILRNCHGKHNDISSLAWKTKSLGTRFKKENQPIIILVKPRINFALYCTKTGHWGPYRPHATRHWPPNISVSSIWCHYMFFTFIRNQDQDIRWPLVLWFLRQICILILYKTYLNIFRDRNRRWQKWRREEWKMGCRAWEDDWRDVCDICNQWLHLKSILKEAR